MQIGLISDIHGDDAGLIKALKFFQAKGVKKVLCAGDLVEKGEGGDSVVALIQKLNIPCVLGNHDEMAPGNQRWIHENLDMTKDSVKKRLLKPETLAYLYTLPRHRRFVLAGKRILILHGSYT